MKGRKVIIVRDSFNLKGQTAKVVDEYISEKGFKKYVLLTEDEAKVTLYEGDFEPLIKRIK
jgi:hypothetical protein